MALVEPPSRGARPTPGHAASAARRRSDGDLIITGRGNYLDDIRTSGVTHAAFVRSPHAHALILSIDVSEAQAAPGVLRVLTGEEAARHIGPIPHHSDPGDAGGQTRRVECLTSSEVTYVGEPVVAVVAEELNEAEAAADLVKIEYELLPAVLDARTAMAPDAPLSYTAWKNNEVQRTRFGEGDVDAVFASAPHTATDWVQMQRYQTTPLEPRGYLAEWPGDGRLVLHATTQLPHPLRSALAGMFSIPESDVRVVAPRLGGAFGHKFPNYPEEGAVCLLSRLVGAPVKWIERRQDAMLVGAREMSHRIGVAYDDDGVILGITDTIVCDTGALGVATGLGMTFVAAMTFPGPYRIRTYSVESIAVATNKPPWNGARGFGKESTCVAIERVVDLVAQRRGLDPALVRHRNLIPSGEFPYWTVAKRIDSGDYHTVLTKALELSGYERLCERRDEARRSGRLVGVGVAYELTPEGADFAGNLARGMDTTTVRVSPRGAVTVLTGVTSPGTGNETGIAQVVAAELGVAVGSVRVIQGDTDTSPHGSGNGSSRGLNLAGGAGALAARDVKARLVGDAGLILGVPPEAITITAGAVYSPRGYEMSVSDLTWQIYTTCLADPRISYEALESTRTYTPAGNLQHVPDELGRVTNYPTHSNSAHVCEVEVDAETGLVRLLGYWAVDDCGVIINPLLVRSQLLGAIVMGIGGALTEHSTFSASGALTSTSFKTYLLQRAPDLPTIHLAHHCTPSPFTLLGTKGAGEGGLGGASAVLNNAVNDALSPLGVRIHRLPLSAPNVHAAINGALS